VNTSSLKSQLLQSLKTSDEYRYSFVEEKIQSGLAAQIRAIREQRQLDPKQFAEKLGKKVSWVYRLEDPNLPPPTIPSLLEVARAYDVDLEVRFRPFSAFLNEANDLSTRSLEVTGFRDELPELERETARDQKETEYAGHAAAPAPLDYFAREWMATNWNSLDAAIYSTELPSYGDVLISKVHGDIIHGNVILDQGSVQESYPSAPPSARLAIVYRNPDPAMKWRVSREDPQGQRKTMGIQNSNTGIGSIA
jgi:transcriptional regulator with XRE-family HTH domain